MAVGLFQNNNFFSGSFVTLRTGRFILANLTEPQHKQIRNSAAEWMVDFAAWMIGNFREASYSTVNFRRSAFWYVQVEKSAGEI